jgi:hypothetical protein
MIDDEEVAITSPSSILSQPSGHSMIAAEVAPVPDTETSHWPGWWGLNFTQRCVSAAEVP